MKLFVFVTFVVCLFQAYNAAPIAGEENRAEAQIRSELEKIPGMDETKIQNIITVIENYENDPIGLLTLGLQGDTCVKNRIDLMQILVKAFMSDVAEKVANKDRTSIAELLFTEKELQVIETELSKTLTPEKVRNAMEILRAYQNSSSEGTKSAAINMLVSAGKALNDGCPTETTANSANQ